MHAGLHTWGSEGDVRPFLALAARLVQSGHEATLVVSSADARDYGLAAQKHGIRLIQTSHPVFENAAKFGKSIAKMWDPAKQIETLLAKTFFPFVEEMAAYDEKLAQECDVLVGHNFMYPLMYAARAAGKPYATATLCHGIIPTCEYSPIPGISVGEWLNRQIWKFAGWSVDRLLLDKVKKARKRFGLPTEGKHAFEEYFSKTLNLIGVSPLMVRVMEDWGPEHRICGFFNLPEKEGGLEISPGLEEFLDAGEPPVYMTFGSMAQFSKEAVARLFTEAAILGNFRAVIQLEWDDVKIPLPSSKYIFRAGKTSHAKVFPRCAAVVHHCGSGTSQSATLAGIPTVPVPVIFDQPFWAMTLEEIGVAPRPLRFGFVTAAKLAREVISVITDEVMKKRAQAVASRMSMEDGTGEAVRRLEALVPGRPGRR